MCRCDYRKTRGAVTITPLMHLDMLCVVLVRLKEVKSGLTFRHTHTHTHRHTHTRARAHTHTHRHTHNGDGGVNA